MSLPGKKKRLETLFVSGDSTLSSAQQWVLLVTRTTECSSFEIVRRIKNSKTLITKKRNPFNGSIYCKNLSFGIEPVRVCFMLLGKT